MLMRAVGFARTTATWRLTRSRAITANGLAFAVDETGDGDRLALLLHGFPQNRFMWRAQAQPLAALGYRVWAPDLRGYGETLPRPREIAAYRGARLLEDIAALIDASDAREAVLIGHDWGGALAWAFAARHLRPLAHLVVINAPHPKVFADVWRASPAQRSRSRYIAFFQLPILPELIAPRALPSVMRRMARGGAWLTPDLLARYEGAARAPGAMRAMLNYYRAGLRFPHDLDASATIETPATLIWGEEDDALGLDLIEPHRARASALAIERLPGVSHWAAEEAPDAVNAILARRLAR